ncbi:helix-turn-helix domain-containing protein [Glacieibacterium frigidum]|uniref:Helix-turn-helix transcriptional regulator n=1 Tax=Glacieibacterium frigidum TaxID=2593303 RepID=A0A552UEV3_9SPHN|nr:helix-turn-helix transcriptional regulator [Glacieibacterium frigidum]TRW16757.1 helix-turn-helix transcriptional regulator [Glacieibacterium frigidum]
MAAVTFAQRLDLVLKALSMSRARLAADLGIDKSLAGRWVSGAVQPSAYNLERLTVLVAGRCPGFTMLDWDRDLDALADQLGVAPAGAPAAPPPAVREALLPPLPYGLVELAKRETRRRGSAYEGRWKATRLSSSGALRFMVEHALIRCDGDTLAFRHFGGGWEVRGWLLVLSVQLYGVICDATDDSLGFYVLNGVTSARATCIDGIFSTVCADRNLTPNSQVVVFERVGDLADDDDAWAAAHIARSAVVPAEQIPERVRAAVARDIGPAAAAAGGEAMMRVPIDRSLCAGALGGD